MVEWLDDLCVAPCENADNSARYARRWAFERHLEIKNKNLELLSGRLNWLFAGGSLLVTGIATLFPTAPPPSFNCNILCTFSEVRGMVICFGVIGMLVSLVTFLGVLSCVWWDIDHWRVANKVHKNESKQVVFNYYYNAYAQVSKEEKALYDGCVHCCKVNLSRINYIGLPFTFLCVFIAITVISSRLMICADVC